MNMRAYDKLSKHLMYPTMGVALNQLWKTCMKCESMVKKTNYVLEQSSIQLSNKIMVYPSKFYSFPNGTNHKLLHCRYWFWSHIQSPWDPPPINALVGKRPLWVSFGKQPINPSFGVTNLAPPTPYPPLPPTLPTHLQF